VLGIAELADELGMSRSTTHRYVITLVALGYLEQVASRKYRLGLRVTDLGLAALGATGLREHAHSHLEELRRRTSHAVALAVLDGQEILYVDRLGPSGRARGTGEPALRAGSRLPAYCTALGKVLLAHLPAAEQRQLLSTIKPKGRAPNTITSRARLRAQLQHVAEQGFALGDRELAADVRAIAVPVRNEAAEVVAAIGLVSRAGDAEVETLRGLLPQLLASAERISARLGFSRASELR
jgi:IclR family pca regulon transcriptional regulator